MIRIGKILLLIFATAFVGGCQLLIDNRTGKSGAVVVVRSEEWDAMRQASIGASQDATLSETDDIDPEVSALKIEPIPGSEVITFSNYTSSNLGGCIATNIIEVRHHGTVKDAITLLKNEAFRLEGNALIVIKMNSNLANHAGTINIEARLLTCPLRMAKGN